MSFALTERQLLDGSKTVTRRIGWAFLKPGDELLAVRKSMGLKKGEKQHALAKIRVKSVVVQTLECAKRSGESALEGFPEMSGGEFVQFFCEKMKCDHWTLVTRIEFEKVQP